MTRVAGWVAVAIQAGCGPGPAATPDNWPAAEVLLVPSARPGDFLDRQKIVATYGERTASFEAVVQKRADELTVLGLTPFGSRAFVLQLRGPVVTFEAFVPQTLPFPPRYILIDIQRVLFPWAAADDGGASDGERTWLRAGETIREERHNGKLVRRTFRRADGRPAGEIVVEYDDGMASDGRPPAHIGFHNGWYGYSLDIETLEHRAL